jgi:hypothetical protein
MGWDLLLTGSLLNQFGTGQSGLWLVPGRHSDVYKISIPRILSVIDAIDNGQKTISNATALMSFAVALLLAIQPPLKENNSMRDIENLLSNKDSPLTLLGESMEVSTGQGPQSRDFRMSFAVRGTHLY